jgi:dCTP deaminase
MPPVEFKTALSRRTCEACQRGHHGACAYMMEMEEVNRGAVDAEDFVMIYSRCICYNASMDRHHDLHEDMVSDAEFVEEVLAAQREIVVHEPTEDMDESEYMSIASPDDFYVPPVMAGGILSDQEIVNALSDGRLKIAPFRPKHLGPASYDLTLNPVLGEVFLPAMVDLGVPPEEYLIYTRMGKDDFYDLRPREFILASTTETIGIPPEFAARVEGKSSLARLGLAVHVTGGFIDPGFEGQITLEMVNLSNSVLRLRPGIRIAQIAFMPVVGEVQRPYGERGNYQYQDGPTGSRYRA